MHDDRPDPFDASAWGPTASRDELATPQIELGIREFGVRLPGSFAIGALRNHVDLQLVECVAVLRLRTFAGWRRERLDCDDVAVAIALALAAGHREFRGIVLDGVTSAGGLALQRLVTFARTSPEHARLLIFSRLGTDNMIFAARIGGCFLSATSIEAALHLLSR